MTFHPLSTDIPKPQKFTYPFCYEPHPLCLLAAREVQEYIVANGLCAGDRDGGKMFGVLVVENGEGRTGYLAAYSGLLQHDAEDGFFVPPVFDAQQPGGYFKLHESEITALNMEIENIEKSGEYIGARREAERLETESNEKIRLYKEEMARAKAARDARRHDAGVITEEEGLAMIRESQFMKAELRRMKKYYRERTAAAALHAGHLEERITGLKKQRKEMSDALQEWLFRQYVLLNVRGEARDIIDIFMEQAGKMPPAGTGDCCAPKMLQYAFKNGMRPVCMAEFWWGPPPTNELRRQGHFYPSCSGKCKPLLGHMLKGLKVDDNPLSDGRAGSLSTVNEPVPEIVYEDDWLMVVNKPAGFLSVPGRSERPSVLSFAKGHCPDADGPMIVHRLDMATSGLLVVAKTKEAHRSLQEQFRQHSVRKRYHAVLDGTWRGAAHGMISLPLCPDIFDRPRQKVDYANGKTAITEFWIIKTENGKTHIHLFPHTGRTHQLRVHCAHGDGLGIPIMGDELYGKKADRLHLHAEYLEFTHPGTLKRMAFEEMKNDE